MSKKGFFEKLDIAGASRLAVIFGESAEDPERTCPFFDLKTRDYKIVETTKNVFRIDAAATEEEYKTVTESACVIVTPPDLRKIQRLPRPAAPKIA
jgi:hypothetical protein